jgi:SAM-dependent MidA family methyltransferase
MKTLPTPHPAAQELSEKLIHLIRQEIQQSDGHITFARFMELALYAPGLGYYNIGTHKLGQHGDFVTAPEISPLFAQCIARQCQQILQELDSGDILEFGAGSGIFAKELLLELEALHALPAHYFILEPSAELRERQIELFNSTCPHLLPRIVWLEKLPEKPLNGIIFANEVLDAMPIHCFEVTEHTIKERCVSWQDDQFIWSHHTPSPELQTYLESITKDRSLPLGYQSEVSLIQPAWIKTLADRLEKGVILLIDYGYSRDEYYRPERGMGTFMCFYQHHKHDNPFILPGLQDMTAHVDFTHLAESAVEGGLTIAGFTTQAAFLLACDLLGIAERASLSEIEKYKINQAIKILTLPGQMGDIVKVMAFSKELDITLIGFTLQDKRYDL